MPSWDRTLDAVSRSGKILMYRTSGICARLVAKRWKIGSMCLTESALGIRSPPRKSYWARAYPPEIRTRVYKCNIRCPSFSLSGASVGKSAAKRNRLREALDEILERLD